MKNKLALSSLSMDLKRVALAIHNGSLETAKKFSQEAQKRIVETDIEILPPYIQKIIRKLQAEEKTLIADDYLMYHTQIQNYVTNLK